MYIDGINETTHPSLLQFTTNNLLIFIFVCSFIIRIIRLIRSSKTKGATDSLSCSLRWVNVISMSYGVSLFSGARSANLGTMMSTVIPSASAICWMVT